MLVVRNADFRGRGRSGLEAGCRSGRRSVGGRDRTLYVEVSGVKLGWHELGG